jgi:hypothetical protein
MIGGTVTRRTRTRVAQAAAGVAVMAGMTAGSMPPAHAGRIISVRQFVNGLHVVQAQATTEGRPYDMRWWTNLRSSESTPAWDTVCAWQGYLAEKHQSGVGFTEYSNYHSGCDFLLALIDWMGWRDLDMPNASYIRAKWRSDSTPNSDWFLVGDLKG